MAVDTFADREIRLQGHVKGILLLYNAYEADPCNADLLALLSQHCLVNACSEEVSCARVQSKIFCSLEEFDIHADA